MLTSKPLKPLFPIRYAHVDSTQPPGTFCAKIWQVHKENLQPPYPLATLLETSTLQSGELNILNLYANIMPIYSVFQFGRGRVLKKVKFSHTKHTFAYGATLSAFIRIPIGPKLGVIKGFLESMQNLT